MTAPVRPARQAAELLDAALVGMDAGAPKAAELSALAGRLRTAAGEVALPTRRAPRGDRIVLGRRPDGPMMVIGDFPAGEATAIHGHGTWGVGVVLSGTGVYERWEPAGGPTENDGTVRLREVREIAAGDTFWFGPPPQDVHRQRVGGAGTRELLLLGADPTPAGREPRRPADDPVERIVAGLYSGDLDALLACFAPDAVIDANVPQWRYQLTGRDAIKEVLAQELLVPNRRCTQLRRVDTADGVLVETEVRFGGSPSGDGERLWRDQHAFRLVDGEIVEHVIYCTGYWEPETIAQQAAEAPLVRR